MIRETIYRSNREGCLDKRIVRRDSNFIVPTRGVLVVDKGLAILGAELKKLNIIVVFMDKVPDDRIKEDFLSLRLFVTRRSEKFKEEACCYEYGIIAIDQIETNDYKKLAKRISREIVKFHLWSKQHGYMLTFKKKRQEQI